MKYELEACVGNFSEAVMAERLGSTRIELCDNLLEGGTTPSYGTIKISKKNIDIPINVIIRPRSGNFVYSIEEFEIMKEDIIACKEIGVNGVVIGALDKNNFIDEVNIKKLVAIAKPLSITFHMAFDEIEDKKKAIDLLSELKIDRILTKGGAISATENIDKLKELNNYANGKTIILPGGGITKDNFREIAKETGCLEFHGTKIVGTLK